MKRTPLTGRLIAALAAIVLAPALSHAAPFEWGRWEGETAYSIAYPVGNTGNQHRKSTHLHAAALFQFETWLAAGIEVGYSTGHRIKGKIEGRDFDIPADGVNDTVNFDSEASRFVFNIGPVARIGRWVQVEGTVIRPYVVAGLGLYHSWMKPGNRTLQGRTSQNVDVTGRISTERAISRFNAGLNIGIGLDQKISDRFSVGGEVRYHHVFTAIDRNADGVDDNPFEVLIPKLKLTYYF